MAIDSNEERYLAALLYAGQAPGWQGLHHTTWFKEYGAWRDKVLHILMHKYKDEWWYGKEDHESLAAITKYQVTELAGFYNYISGSKKWTEIPRI